MKDFIFQRRPIVTLATNTFINVPKILKFDDVTLIEIIQDMKVGFTTQIPIYHPDGTYLAKVKGNRLYLTEYGQKANLRINKLSNVWECKLDSNTLFELHLQSGDSFKTLAELYTPEGYFVKCSESPTPNVINSNGDSLRIGGLTMSGSTIQNAEVGLWIKGSGTILIGVNE